MDSLERAAREIFETWSKTSLDMFRKQAEKEFNGTAFNSLRLSTNGVDGQRTMLAICITGAHEISLAESWFDFADRGALEDWHSYTLTRMMAHAETMTGGIGYQDLRDAAGKRISVVLVATRPDKIELLTKIFSLP